MKALSIVFVLLAAVTLSSPAFAQDGSGGAGGGGGGGGGGGHAHRTKAASATDRIPTRWLVSEPEADAVDPVPEGNGITESDAEATYIAERNAGVGVCLMGETYAFVISVADADKCDALMWISAESWAHNQRKLMDESTSSKIIEPPGALQSCSHCSGTCQTVSWENGGSDYEGIDAGGGQSPSECLAVIKKTCESRKARYFATARCGN